MSRAGGTGHPPDGGRTATTFERACVRASLRTVPAAFRRRFGEAMNGAVEDGLAARSGPTRIVFLLRSVLGLLGVGIRERIAPTPLPTGSASPPSPDRGPLMDVLLQELRFAVRALRRRPAFTTVAVLTLALGIGANSAIFSVVDGVLLRPLPYPEPEGLQMVWAYDLTEEPARGSMSKPDLEDIAELPGVEAVEGWSPTSATLTGGDRPELLDGARVTGGILGILGVAPQLGRDLRHDESVPGAPLTVVVSHDLWQGRLGGRPDVIGTTLEIAEQPYEIVGVAPPGFDYPDGAGLWLPYQLDPEGCARGCHTLRTVLRLEAGASPDGVESALATLAARLSDAYPESNFQKGFHLESLVDYQVGDVRQGLWLLLGAVGIVLLIACANVANLLLVRGSSRAEEVAVRSALGAAPRRMLASVLAESGVLAAAGAGLGLAIAAGAIAAFRRVPAGTIPRMESVALDLRVVAFTLGVAFLVVLIFGLAPALQLRSAAARHLTGRARGGQDRRDARSRSFLLAAEVALSVVLLSGAGLFIRSLSELRAVDLGFTEREVARFNLALPEARYETLDQVAGFYRRLEERLAALPGVRAVGSSYGPPLGSGNIVGEVEIEGRAEPLPGEETYAALHPVTPGFLETLGIEVRRGRGIEPTDTDDSEPVALVSETFVRENFPNEDPLGQRVDVTASFGLDQDEPFTVVGVVADTRRRLTDDFRAQLYVPHAQFGPGFMTVHMAGEAGAGGLLAAARQVVAEIEPNVPLTRAETMVEAVDRATATTRFYLALVAAFGVLAVVLAAVGLYGVVSYLVSRRTREIGVRVALGAGSGRVRTMVVLQGLIPALGGLAVGVAAAVASGRVVESVLFQVEAQDPLVLGSVVVLLLGVTIVATLVPARRATRVDPVEALRAE